MILEGSLKMQVGPVSDYDVLALDSISGDSKFSIYILFIFEKTMLVKYVLETYIIRVINILIRIMMAKSKYFFINIILMDPNF